MAWQCIFYLLLSEGLLVLHKNPSGLPNWSTQDITPIRCHSHNDYRRHVPLHSALRTGCISVEVSVWPWENEVLVGDSRYTVLQGTLQSVYLDPLKNLLDRNNAPSHDWQELGNQDMVGLFSSDTKQTFALMLDFKHDGDQIWSILLEHLHPFREKGYLTYFNGSDVTYGPITVVASGAVPSHRILENTTYRDVFYDAPLNNLTFPAEIAKDYGAHPMDKFYSPSNSYYASADLQKEIGPLSLNRLSDFQLDTIRNQVQAAHKLGLKVRYSGIPTKPTGLRSHIWHVLVHEGVDVIDIDDLRGVTKLDWRARRWWKG